MNILICLPFEPEAPKGNSIAANRLRSGFLRLGHHVTLLGFPDIDDPTCLGQVVAAGRPDVCLIMHAWRCAAAATWLHRETAIPTVVSLRGTDLNEMLDDPTTGPVITGVLRECHRLVVFHAENREALATRDKAWKDKIRIVPNGARLPPSRADYSARLQIPSHAVCLVSVCGLREVKRPVLVLPWLQELIDEGRSLALIHVGPPLEAATAQAFHAFRETHPWVRHLDRVSHEEMDAVFRLGRIFVSASRSEGMPHAVREAMLSGLPLLLSDIEGHRRMASPEREALFFRDRESFLVQARRLVDDGTGRASLGNSARERAEKDLAQTDEIRGYLDIFEEVVQSGEKP